MGLSAVFIVATLLGVDTPISQVQGSGATSPLVGQTVTVVGIVTGRTSSGYYLQTPAAMVDADPATSEGLFVFTSSAPPAAAAVGASVRVTGTVTEFVPSAGALIYSPPVTQLNGPSALASLSIGNPVPAAVTLTAAELDGVNTLTALERYEGMRVRLPAMTVVEPTQGSTIEASATSTSTGVFTLASAALARPMREPGVHANRPLPDVTKTMTPRFDMNPERVRIDSDALGQAAVEVLAGQTVTSLTGVLTVAQELWTVLPDAAPTVAGTGVSLSAVPAPLAREATVASLNLDRFFDDVDAPAVGDVVVPATVLSNRMGKMSLLVRNILRSPDIIVATEAENLTVLQALANRINMDAIATGAPSPSYVAYLVEGSDPAGIDVGLLVKSRRINVVSVTQEGASAMFVDPTNGQMAPVYPRPPLRLQAEVLRPPLAPLPLTVIGLGFRSDNGVDDPITGARIRANRDAQADFVAQLAQARQAADAGEPLLIVGDTAAYAFNDGYVDVLGALRGQPAPAAEVAQPSVDRLTPDLELLTARLPAAQRYDRTSLGNAEQKNHALATRAFGCRVTQVAMGRVAADFPASLRSVFLRPERATDVDPLVVYFQVDAPCPVCGNGSVESGEQCDDGNTTSGDCCSSVCAFEPSTTVCRAAVGLCGVAETCTGTSASCPIDAHAIDGTACADTDVCNGAEVCSAGACAAPMPLSCDDTDACTTDACDPLGGCTHAPACGLDGGTDAGVDGGVDAGVVTDAGTTEPFDAGSTVIDSGTAPADAGSNPPGPPKGCGCQSGALPLLLAGFPLVLRRRRKSP